MNNERNCLSFWYPALEKIGERTPKTEIVRIPEGLELNCFMDNDFRDVDEEKQKAMMESLLKELGDAADRNGLPCFLRTGYTSGKFMWKKTCFLEERDALMDHVLVLVEISECCSMIGLPYDVWALREMLAPMTLMHAHGGMPVNLELRIFAHPGGCYCAHNYWPAGALEQGRPDNGNWREIMEDLYRKTDELVETGDLARRSRAIASELGGSWSIDWLRDVRGSGTWYVTDMAVMEDSYHWPAGVNAPVRMN